MNRRMQVIAKCQPRRQLRVGASAPQIDDHRPGDGGSALIPGDLGHHMQRQVDAGGDPSAGVDRAVFDENPVLQYLRAWRQLTQIVVMAMMRGALPAIQQTGITRQQRAGTDAQQAVARLDVSA